MINFYPQRVPFFKALKILFTRQVWLAVHLGEYGQFAAQVIYDTPKGAQPLTAEIMDQQRQMAQESQESAAAAAESEAEPVPQPEQKPPPMFSTRYAPPPKNRKQRRAENRRK